MKAKGQTTMAKVSSRACGEGCSLIQWLSGRRALPVEAAPLSIVVQRSGVDYMAFGGPATAIEPDMLARSFAHNCYA
jgi:hypothetical protein